MLKDNLAKKLAEQDGKNTRNILASKAGISQASFSNIMTGDIKNPGVYIVAKLAKELNCSIDELIGRNTQVSKSKKTSKGIAPIIFQPDLALKTSMTVLDLLDKTKQDVSFKEFLHITAAVYKYSVGKKENLVDEYFAGWFVQDFLDSKKDK